MNAKPSLYWFDKPLTYTRHAQNRCYLREAPFLDYLPLNARYISTKIHKYRKEPVHKYFVDIDGEVLCIILNDYGLVITNYFVNAMYKSRTKKEKPKVTNYFKYPWLEFEDQRYDYA